jgi:hypothetical protein
MLLCPQCKTVHEQRTICPECGERLVGRERGGVGPRPPRWQHTPWGRIFIGVIFAQGLWFGARQLLKGVVLGFLSDGGSPEKMPQVVLLYQGAEALTVIVACVLAGGGQRSGVFIGTMVGVCSGVLSLLLQPFLDLPPSAIHFVGLPILLAFCGAIGGWVGSTLWKPIPLEAFPGVLEPQEKQSPPPPRKNTFLIGKISWIRVVLGTFLAVAGTLAAETIFTQVIYYSGGRLTASNGLMDKIIIWEIKALALLLGGAFAGANSFNGFKQGLIVAFASGGILVWMQLNAAKQVFEFALFTTIGSFCLCVVGGWFGSQLFPPILKLPRKRRGLGPASV